LPHTCYAYVECSDAHTQNRAGVSKFNIRLLSESGEVLIKFKNLYLRPLARPLLSNHSLEVSEVAIG